MDDGEDTGGGTVDATSGSTAPVTSDTTASGATDTGAPVECGSLTLEECNGHRECRDASAPEATPQGEPGAYYCSDLSLPFACVSIDCEPVPGTPILCKIDDPSVAVWVLEECIPTGWQLCPDATCV